jgi:Clostripain family
MAGLEVAFQTREFSSYTVGSEEIEPPIGWAYGAFIEQLTQAQGQFAPIDLCKAIVTDYNDGVRNVGVHLTTQSAINMSIVAPLAAALDDLGKLVKELVGTQYGLVARAEKTATRFYDTDFLDLGDFVGLLSAQMQDPRLDKITQLLKDATVASLFSFSTGRQSPTGLSIYFPTRPIYDDAYSVLDLTKGAPSWRDAIKAYHFLA